MHIGPHVNARIADLFNALVLGERLAQGCAHRQAVIAADTKIRHFFTHQAQQEAFHALVLKGTVAVLDCKRNADTPLIQALHAYGARLEADLDARRLAPSLLGMQVMLEGIGAVVLQKLDVSLSDRHIPRFAPFRRLVLKQEDAHHAFGLHMLKQIITADPAQIEPLRAAARDYLALARDLLIACSELFQHFDSSVIDYSASVEQHLPRWLTQTAP
ncbi:MAG: hypothetical protein ABIS68_02700 [Casimicrobiaceae bacterium]